MNQVRAGDAVAVCLETPPLAKPSMQINFITPYNTPLAKDILARENSQNGRPDEAIAEYRRLLRAGSESTHIYLIHPRYHSQLARLYEEIGEPAKAKAQYEKYLDLMKDADPGIAEVAAARRWLAASKN